MPSTDPNRLSANMGQLGEYGKNHGRETRALERNVADAIKRIQDYCNDVLTAAIGVIGGRSPLLVIPIKSGTFTLLGGRSVIPVQLVDTSTTAGTATLPFLVVGMNVIVKDATFNAAANSVTISPPESLTNIDGQLVPYVLATNNGSVWLTCDGTGWWSV